MARRAKDIELDPVVVLIEEPTESFDAWLRDLQAPPPIDLWTSGADLVVEARADEE